MDKRYRDKLYNYLGESVLGKKESFDKLIATSQQYRDKIYNHLGESVLGKQEAFNYLLKQDEVSELGELYKEYGKSTPLEPIVSKQGEEPPPVDWESINKKAQSQRPFTRDNGIDENGNTSESSHVMATEIYNGKWQSFPTIFPKEGNTGSRDPKDWMDFGDDKEGAFKEAQKRGEVFDFGDNKEAALKFGEGSWKPVDNDTNPVYDIDPLIQELGKVKKRSLEIDENRLNEALYNTDYLLGLSKYAEQKGEIVELTES